MSDNKRLTNKNAPLEDRLEGAVKGAINGYKDGGKGIGRINPVSRPVQVVGQAIFHAIKPYNRPSDPATANRDKDGKITYYGQNED